MRWNAYMNYFLCMNIADDTTCMPWNNGSGSFSFCLEHAIIISYLLNNRHGKLIDPHSNKIYHIHTSISYSALHHPSVLDNMCNNYRQSQPKSSNLESLDRLIETLSNSTPAAANTNDPIDSLSSSLKSIYTTMCMFDSLTLPYTSTMPITKSKSLSSPQVMRQRSRVRRGHQATMVIVPTKCHDGRTVQRSSPAA